MNNSKNTFRIKINSDKISSQNSRRIILKMLVGLGIIAVIFFMAIKISQRKLSELSKTVSKIIEPSIKLITLKEISGCLYGAEANVKAYSIRKDTTYLINYGNYISQLDSRLDTLLWLSIENKIVDTETAKTNQIFLVHIDTLRELLNRRIDLFYEYMRFKAGQNSQDILLQLLLKIKTDGKIKKPEQKTDTLKKSFLSRLFSSKKNKKIIEPAASSDSIQKTFQNIIIQTQLNEKIKAKEQFSKEIDITHREYIAMNNIFFLLKKIEERELAESIKRIRIATGETKEKIKFISNALALFGLIITIFFILLIYLDIRKTKHFKDQLLLTKINAEKLVSQYSRSLIEASLDPLVTINSDGKVTDVNKATVNITGMEREELTGTDFFDYFTEPQMAREVYQEVFANGYVKDYPLTLRHIDGTLTDVLFNGSVYKDDTGNVLGVVVVARDITKQKIFENELIDAKRKAEESTKLKEAFLANMSHEIRTPMNAIMGFSELLSHKKLEEEEKEYVKIIKSAGDNLLTIINDILDISKIEAGMMSFESCNFSIKETFKSLLVLLTEKTKEKQIELSFNCDNDVPDILFGDHTRLTQIIINLAGNAIKFTKNGENRKGSVQVHARVLKKENENIYIEFVVTDNGIGIPKDKLEGIFERFQQAESHTTRLYGGTGLGLSIAKQLVDLQGGQMSVKSELKFGSVFTFSIPYKKAFTTQIEQEETEKKYNMNDLSKLNILMVEDNQLNVKLILCLFNENNLKLTVAENGIVGIEMLKENNFDIILMDMEMPVMNGYEAAVYIRKELKNNIPIIAMTAHAMAGEKDRCLNLGMNDYISKPINAILLFEKIYKLTQNA